MDNDDPKESPPLNELFHLMQGDRSEDGKDTYNVPWLLEYVLMSELVLVPSRVVLIQNILEDSDFYFELISKIYILVKKSYESNQLIDFELFVHEASPHVLERYLFELAARAERRSDDSLVHYANQIKKHSLLRKLSNMGEDLLNLRESKTESFPSNTLAKISETLRSLTNTDESKGKDEVSDCNFIMKEVFERLTSIPDKKPSVNSGFYLLDQMTGGFQNGDFIIIAARPSMGKTALALSISHSVVRSQKSVLFFSLEMSKEQLGSRLISSNAGIDLLSLRNGNLKEKEWDRVGRSVSYFSHLPFHVNDSTALGCQDILRIASDFKSSNPHGVDLIIVDYLQMIVPTKEQNRYMEISNISRDLKMIAKELDRPLLVLSQLNRNLEQRSDKRPTLSDLRDSGALEQDADLICFVYRDCVYNPSEDTKEDAEILVAKHRNGPTGTVRLTFSSSLATFYNYRKEQKYE